jgi:hypothetical protein
MENVFNPGTWEHVKEKIKEISPEITDSDLQLEPGRENELLDGLVLKLHKTKEQIKDWLESISFNTSIAG